MCLHKRTIKNRVATYKKNSFDKFLIDVPCGHCPECRKTKQNDWLVRAYFDYTNNMYQSSYFVTLDFNDKYLPRYNGVACFDSELMKKFFKRIRHYLPAFTFLYSSDYGGALNRPHYHVMFLFKDIVPYYIFWRVINHQWKYGDHEQITELASCNDSLWNCIRYVCKYTTKDLSFDLVQREKNLPNRYCSRTQASQFFGFSALEEGDITFDMLKNGDPVFLPIGKNGMLIPFAIPRYYELKFTKYTVYYPEFRKTEFFNSDEGLQLQEFRHNGRYDYILMELASSFDMKLHLTDSFSKFKELYPDSPYINFTWNEILFDCLSEDSFKEFLYLSPFFKRTKDWKLCKAYGKLIDTRYMDDWIDHLYYCPFADRFNQLLHLWRLYHQELAYTEYLIKSHDEIEQAKLRLLAKIKKKPKYRKYLNKVHFDYSSLYPMPVYEFVLAFDDFVSKSDVPHVRKCSDVSAITKFSDYRMRKYIV